MLGILSDNELDVVELDLPPPAMERRHSRLKLRDESDSTL